MRMRTMLKATLTAAAIVALAWPLLFWGKPESLADNGRNIQQNNTLLHFVVTPQRSPTW